MKKFIAGLSVFFGLQGLFTTFYFAFFSYESLNGLTSYLLFSTRPYSFNIMQRMIEIDRDGNTSHSIGVSLLNVLLYTSFIIGGIIYYRSKYTENRILSFNFSIAVLSSVNGFIFLLFNLSKITGAQWFLFLVYTVIMIFYFWFSKVVIQRYFQTEKLNVYSELNYAGEEITYLDNAGKWKRFLNLLIDNSFIVILAYSFVQNASYANPIGGFFNSLESVFGERLGALVYFSIIKFIYYFIFESIFRSTPAKFLTACKVTDEEGNPPPLSSIFSRTLCRFIPFESISFLMNKNLHDGYSATYVINLEKKPNYTDRKYLLGFGLSFLLILIIYSYPYFKYF